VTHQLAGFRPGGGQAHAVNDIVEPALEQGEQVGTRVALAALGFSKVPTELALKHTVHALDLLLFTQLQSVIGRPCTRRAAMLAGLGVELALVGERATCTLEKKVSPFASGQFGFGSGIACHLKSSWDTQPRLRLVCTPHQQDGLAEGADSGLGEKNDDGVRCGAFWAGGNRCAERA